MNLFIFCLEHEIFELANLGAINDCIQPWRADGRIPKNGDVARFYATKFGLRTGDIHCVTIIDSLTLAICPKTHAVRLEGRSSDDDEKFVLAYKCGLFDADDLFVGLQSQFNGFVIAFHIDRTIRCGDV